MSQIRADIDALRATIAAMRQGSGNISSAFQQATQAMEALRGSRWSGQHRQQAEELWERIAARFGAMTEALEALASRTERFANSLEEAGRQFGSDAAPPPASSSNGIPQPAPTPRPASPPTDAAPPAAPSNRSAILNQKVRLSNGVEIPVAQLDGRTPVSGMDSIYGKPGQLPLNAAITSTPENRDPDLYAAVINQFGVESNPRYAPDGYTYCNTFAGDVVRAMGAPLPTKSDLGIGAPGDRATAGTQALYRWLTTSSSAHGWREVDPNTPEGLRLLQDHVNAGKPALAADEGHVAVIRPGQQADSVADLRIAQAGARNLNNVRLGDAGLGTAFRPRYFIHA